MGKGLGPLLRWSAAAVVLLTLLSACSTGQLTATETASGAPGGGDAGALSFDGGAAGGGGGRANTAAVDYCYVISGGAMHELRRLVDSRLIAFNADMSDFVPEVAERWEQTGDTVTFHLRKNARWHDGETLTATDVLFTFNTLASKETGSRYAQNFANVKGYDQVKDGSAQTLSGLTAPDAYTVAVALTKTDSGFLPNLPFLDILPEHILGSVPKNKLCDQPYWTEKRVGSGPYKWVQRLEGQRIELEANPDYFLGKPKIAKINHLLFANFETSLAAFEQQTSMVAPITAANMEYVKRMPFARIEATPAGVGAVWINNKLPEFADKRVRQAISYAIDRKSIAEHIFNGTAKPAWSELPFLTWIQPPDLNHYDYNPEKARSLLQEAGWNPSKSYTLWYYYPDEVTAVAMEAVQQYLEAVGINVKPRRDEGGALTQAQNDGTWELVYGSNGAMPDPTSLATIWSCEVQATWSYCNQAFDKAMAEGLGTLDKAQQTVAYQKAMKILNQDQPWVWLFDRQNLIAVNKKLDTGGKGAWGAGHVGYHNFAEQWTLTP